MFTEEQKQWYEAYKAVQMSGKYNMIMEANRAAIEAGLTLAQYKWVIQNYGELQKGDS